MDCGFDHGTGDKGDVFEFEQRISKCDFKTALKNLSEFAGLTECANYNHQNRPLLHKTSISKAVVAKWNELLFSDRGKAARKYLNSRGLSDDTLKQYLLGYDAQSQTVTIPLFWEGDECKALKRFYFDGIGWKKKDGKKVVTTLGQVVLYCVDRVAAVKDVVICEGELDCLLLRQNGFDAITGSGGAGTWKNEWNIHLQNKNVTMLYDSDDQGIKGSQSVAERLTGIAVSIRIAELFPRDEAGPERKDVTDYFQSGKTKEDLRLLLQNAKEYSKNRKSQNNSVWSNEAEGLNQTKVANKILNENELIYVAGDFYIYIAGVWKKDDTRKVERIIKKYLNDKATKFKIESIKYLVSIDAQLRPSDLNPNPFLLNFKNGMFDLESLQLTTHSTEYYSTIQFSYDYQEVATCPRWKQFVDEIFQGDKSLIDLLQEIFGYILTQDSTMQKMFWFIGEGANGKGVVLKVLESLINKANRTSLDIRNLTSPFVRAAMYNKLLSINGDFPKKFFGNEDIIKMIVGGDTIDAQEKYKPQIEFTPTCRFIFAMNSLPKTDDKSFGFYRRVIIVPFTRVFREEEQDRSLVEKLLCELPGIFIWAVDGLKRLRINRKFTESQKSNELLENYKSEQNSVSMFVEEMCVHDCNAKVKASDLWKRYEEFCAETDIEPLVRREFAKQLKYNYDFFVKTHRWLGEAPQRTYFGIGLKINLNADEENTLQITGE